MNYGPERPEPDRGVAIGHGLFGADGDLHLVPGEGVILHWASAAGDGCGP